MNQYTYIGKDGKAVLARDLEDERDALKERVKNLESALRGLDPYLDAIVFHAPTRDEHGPYWLVFAARQALADEPTQ